jgi:subtilisin family serine protease
MSPPDFGDGGSSDRRRRFGPGFNGPMTPDRLFEEAGPNRGRGPSEIIERFPPRSKFRPTTAPMPPRRNPAPRQRFRARELLVTVQGAQPDAVAGRLARSFNLVMRESRGFALLQDRRVYRFSIRDNRGMDNLRAAIANVPGVAQTSPNYYHYLQGEMGGDAGWMQYALPKLRIPDTLELASGRGVTVAVIDSGVDIKHPALKGADIAYYDATDNTVKDPDMHGTAIAGIIAGKGDVQGIAPGVKMLAIRAFASEELGVSPTTTSLAMARAMDIAVARGAKIINMSFAGAEDPLMTSLIEAAHAKGVVCIAAAGNQGPDAPPAYPAANDKVIGITATDEKDGLYDMANRGAYVSVAAPGVDILVPVTGEALDYMSGTSFAAAHITGIVALLLERNPKLTPDQVRDILSQAAHDLGKPGQDDEFGAGLADAYGTVTRARLTIRVQSSSVNR